MKPDDKLAYEAFLVLEQQRGHVRVSDWYDALVPQFLTDQEFYDSATRLLEHGHIGWAAGGRRLESRPVAGRWAVVATEAVLWCAGALMLAGTVWAALGAGI